MENDWLKFRRLSQDCIVKNDIPNAISYLEKAIGIARQTNPPELAIMYNSLAQRYLEIGNLIAAEAVARKSIAQELEFADGDKKTTHLASYYMMLGEVLKEQSRFEEALQNADEGIAIFARHHRKDDPFFENLLKYRKFLIENKWRG